MHPKPHKYRADIDGLRGFAVLAVVGFHAFPGKVSSGFVGVDVFFVISGFLIAGLLYESLERGTFSLVDFYSRRVRRIFPALLTMLFACFAFGWHALLSDEYMQLGKHVLAGAGFVSNLVLWNESGYFDTSADLKPLLHLWSLGIEEQFYILFPVLLVAVWKFKARVMLILSILAISSFALNVLRIENDPVGTFFSPQTRFWEILCGAILARLQMSKAGESSILHHGSSAVGILILFVSLFTVPPAGHFPGWWALLPTLGAVLIILAGPRAWINRTLLSHPGIVWFGLISFPLYLWHWPLLSFARIIEGEMPPKELRALLVLLSVLMAWLTYRFVETPLRFGNFLRMKTIGLCCFMFCGGALGYLGYSREGYIERKTVKGLKQNRNELVRTSEQDESCLRYVGGKPSYVYCRYSDIGSSRTTAVIGDSHAHAAYPGIAEFLAEKRINTVLLANSNCPTLIGGEHGRTKEQRDRCKNQILEIIETVKRKADIVDVLIFTRGAVYLTGSEFGSIERDESLIIPADVYQASLQRTVDELRKAGKNPVYVSENPEMKRHPTACLPRPLRPKARDCTVPLEEVHARQRVYLDILAGLKNVSVIQTLDAFCPNAVCQFFDFEGELLYADRDHVSVTGSRLQARSVLSF